MEKVVQLNQNEVFEDICTYINNLESANTKTRYISSLRLLFEWKYDLKLEWLKHEHLNKLNYRDMMEFRNYLRDELNYACNTTNSTMNNIYASLKQIRKMNPNGYSKLHVDDLRLSPLKVLDEEHHGDIELSELMDIIELVKAFPEKKKPKEKVAFLTIAFHTGVRKTGLLNCKFKDLRQEYGLWVLYYTIKGKQSCVALRDEDAQLLLDLKKTDDSEELIFKISGRGIQRMMDEAIDKLGIDKNRGITVHSIRRLSGQETYYSSGKDLVLAQQHLNHSSPEVTRTYIQKKEDLLNSPSLYIGKEIDDNLVDHLDNGQFKDVFSKMSRGAKWEFLNKMKELGYSND